MELTGFTSFHMADDREMANLPPEAIYQAALEADRADAEALFISCTAIRACDVVERLERTLGKPVVTSIQAMFRQCLATTPGIRGRSKGTGACCDWARSPEPRSGRGDWPAT